MYEAKYSKYITENNARFATPEEIKACCHSIRKNEKNSRCGAVLYQDENALYVDDSDAHMYIQGATGSKKSRVEVFNAVLSILNAGEHLIVNDPKGEIYRKTASFARANGYNVQVMNFRDVHKSSGWNPLSFPYRLDRRGEYAESQQALSDFVEAVMGASKEKCVDIFWPDMSGMELSGCSKVLMKSVSEDYFNLANLIKLTHQENFYTLRELLEMMDQNSSAVIELHGVLDLTAEKTVSCIYSTLAAALKPFVQNEALLDLLCRNDISFENLFDPEKREAIYVIYPDEKNSLGFLVNLFYTQCYQYLIFHSAKRKDSRLLKRVNFVLDEFSNLPAIENFENRISESRGHNIRYFLISQSYGQLENKYDKNAKTVIANCDWIIFPGKDIDFMKMISEMCGRKYDHYGREHDLISPCELQHLKKYEDGAEALILKSGQYPFVTKLPDYEYIDIFEKYPDAEMREIKSNSKPKFITFTEWYNGIFSGRFEFPFPETKRSKK